MVSDVVLNKVATIECCVRRARDEYLKAPDSFDADHARQDAAILNIQRACEAAPDQGLHLIRQNRLGIPQARFIHPAGGGTTHPAGPGREAQAHGRLSHYRGARRPEVTTPHCGCHYHLAPE